MIRYTSETWWTKHFLMSDTFDVFCYIWLDMHLKYDEQNQFLISDGKTGGFRLHEVVAVWFVGSLVRDMSLVWMLLYTLLFQFLASIIYPVVGEFYLGKFHRENGTGKIPPAENSTYRKFHLFFVGRIFHRLNFPSGILPVEFS